MDNIFKYSYAQFVSDSKNLCDKSNGVFKVCSSPLLSINYIKANIQLMEEKYSLEMNILLWYIECGLFKDYGIDNFSLRRQVAMKKRKTLKKRKEPVN